MYSYMRWLPLLLIGMATFAQAAEPTRWKPPHPMPSFDIQLNDPRGLSDIPNVAVLELDHDTSPTLLSSVRARGTKLICYINAGAWESYRSDARSFPKAVLGKAYDGYPDERWLDIRRIDLLAPIMRARMDQCKKKGFVAIDPDNVNGYENRTGFPLTQANQLAYNRWLMNEAHARGLSIVLKNTPALAAQLAKDGYDMALTESCVSDAFCSYFTPFTATKRPVVDLEYIDEGMTIKTACPTLRKLGFYGLVKTSSSSIGKARQACN